MAIEYKPRNKKEVVANAADSYGRQLQRINKNYPSSMDDYFYNRGGWQENDPIARYEREMESKQDDIYNANVDYADRVYSGMEGIYKRAMGPKMVDAKEDYINGRYPNDNPYQQVFESSVGGPKTSAWHDTPKPTTHYGALATKPAEAAREAMQGSRYARTAAPGYPQSARSLGAQAKPYLKEYADADENGIEYGDGYDEYYAFGDRNKYSNDSENEAAMRMAYSRLKSGRR